MSDLPVRDCAGCGQSDDHPRLQYDDNGEVRLFHYDCVPHYLQPLVPEAALKATKAGKRGDAVRQAVIKSNEKES